MTTSTAGTGDAPEMLVECRECGFRETVPVGGDPAPADAVVDHGTATGHKLSLSLVEE